MRWLWRLFKRKPKITDAEFMCLLREHVKEHQEWIGKLMYDNELREHLNHLKHLEEHEKIRARTI